MVGSSQKPELLEPEDLVGWTWNSEVLVGLKRRTNWKLCVLGRQQVHHKDCGGDDPNSSLGHLDVRLGTVPIPSFADGFIPFNSEKLLRQHPYFSNVSGGSYSITFFLICFFCVPIPACLVLVYKKSMWHALPRAMVAWKIAPSFAYKTAFVAGLVLIAHSLTNYSMARLFNWCEPSLSRSTYTNAFGFRSFLDMTSATKFAHRNSLVWTVNS